MASDSAKPDNTTAPPAKADALDGVEVQDLTPHIRRQLGADPSVVGALIISIKPDSNSSTAGLHPGDVIIEINRQPVANADSAVRLCKAVLSDKIVVKIWRPTRNGGKFLFLDVDNTKPAQ
jgi:serine protease Do